MLARHQLMAQLKRCLFYHSHGAGEKNIVTYIAAAVLTVYTVVAQTASFLWCREWLEEKVFLLRPLRLRFCKWTCVFISDDEIT